MCVLLETRLYGLMPAQGVELLNDHAALSFPSTQMLLVVITPALVPPPGQTLELEC